MPLLFLKKPKLRGRLCETPQDGAACAGCGASCCLGFPSVELSAAEYEILKSLGAKRLEFTLAGRFFLMIENGCEFLDGGRCAIYDHRPDICRRFTCIS